MTGDRPVRSDFYWSLMTGGPWNERPVEAIFTNPQFNPHILSAGNAKQRMRKEAIVAKEREEDVQRMKEYAIMLKKQEDARAEFFQGRSAKMDKNASKNVEARQEEFKAAKARELRDLRFQKEKDDAIVEEQRKKAAWRKKNQQDINDWLNKSIQAKVEARKKEKSMYIEINNYAKQKAAEVRNCVLWLCCCCCA